MPRYALASLIIVTLVALLGPGNAPRTKPQQREPTSSFQEAVQQAWSLKTEIKINGYTFRLFEDRSWLGEEYFEVWKDGQQVYVEGPNLYHYYVRPADHVGQDITGEGAPELVLESYSRGAHCCFSYDIFAFGPQFRRVTHLDGSSCSFDFKDLDGDQIYEAIGCDETFAYWYTCYACFRSPMVILRFRDGKYRLAPDLMKRAAPTAEELQAKLKAVRQDWDLHASEIAIPSQVWEYMLELIYSDNSGAAWRFLDMAWPQGTDGKERFSQEFREQLARSPYGADLAQAPVAQSEQAMSCSVSAQKCQQEWADTQNHSDEKWTNRRPLTQLSLPPPGETTCDTWDDTRHLFQPARPGWLRYTNERFGFSVEVPTDWHEVCPPINGDGLAIEPPDGLAQIVFSGFNNVMEGSNPEGLQTLDEYMGSRGQSVLIDGHVGREVIGSNSVAPAAEDCGCFKSRSIALLGLFSGRGMHVMAPPHLFDRYNAVFDEMVKTYRAGSMDD